MNSGKKFEQNFANSVPEDVYFMRIKDSANNFQRGPQSHFATQNPFDCFVVYKGFFIPMELKSTQSKSFSIQSEQIEKGKDIKYHQIQSLLKASTYDGVIAGFVLDFRESNTYWIDIQDFCEFNDNTTKKSINEQDVIEYNGVMIHKTKLKVNYRYNVRGLIDYIVSTRG